MSHTWGSSDRWVWSNGGVKKLEGKHNCSATLSTMNLTWNHLRLNWRSCFPIHNLHFIWHTAYVLVKNGLLNISINSSTSEFSCYGCWSKGNWKQWNCLSVGNNGLWTSTCMIWSSMLHLGRGGQEGCHGLDDTENSGSSQQALKPPAERTITIN